MKQFFIICLLILLSTQSYAGYQLVCQGQSPSSTHKPIRVDCNSRTEFIRKLKQSWMMIRQSEMRGTVEQLCWEALKDARDLHPSIPIKGITDAFFKRCNMGLEYVN